LSNLGSLLGRWFAHDGGLSSSHCTFSFGQLCLEPRNGRPLR
jgi:hypothetical protein